MHFLDLVFGLAARGPRFFADGWGDRALCDAIDPEALSRRRIPGLEVKLGPRRRSLGGLLREGAFESPEARLPACSRRARVQLLLPERELRGVAVHLAAAGDQGFAVRLRFAAPLLARGIGALVLENPFYGSRRPPGQFGPAVRSLSDLHLMGAAAFQEGRALLRWLRDAQGVPLVGVTGYSMGGQMAAMVGASMPFPCAVVPVAPACSPDSVLRDGVLRHVAHWAALAAAGEDAAAAREAVCAHLARFSVCTLPAPVLPEAAIVVGTSGDGVVPPAEMRRIAAHWGAELRWLDAGHVSAVLRHQGAMRDAIADAFGRLEVALARATRPSDRDRVPRRARGSGARAPDAPASAAARGRSPDPAPVPRT
jgi:predicted alpha/beta-hydrolase family hydrolase